tara:strand:+ start:194 stop:988 length:795 start_codon:yes stop_codon:yes gene_type:complete
MRSKEYKEILDNLTIAIIGPYHEQSLNNIDNYKKICDNVLVFMWSDVAEEKVLKYKKYIADDNHVTLYTEKSPEQEKQQVKSCIFQHYKTLLPHTKGIMRAAKKCQTKYMIRTRSDESFSDLSPMIKMFSQNTNLVISSNIVWRTNFKNRHKHMGDHAFISDTSTIRNVYEKFYNSAFDTFRNMNIQQYEKRRQEHVACEEILYDYFLEFGKTPVPIDVNNLGDFLVSVAGKKYRSKKDLLRLLNQCPDLLINWFDYWSSLSEK